MKTVAFYTLGCKVNQYETNAMEQQFIEKGYKIIGFHQKADVYIINTCTVTNISDKKSRQFLRKAKQNNPDAIVVAVGCYAQVAKEKLEEIEEIDIILGNNEKKEIVKYVEEYQKKITANIVGKDIPIVQKTTECASKTTKDKLSHLEDIMHQKDFVDFGNTVHIDKTRAVVKVQDGCDRFCSYCIIPYARGRVRSRKMESVIEEITMLAQKGVKEIIVTGIHIASYGKDLREKITLIDLLEKMNQIDGIQRIRLGSLEPTIITKEFLNRLKKLEKICHHFHLSLQSACNETLKRMNRTYTIEKFKEVVRLLRKTYKDVILTTDIIVGFPGETQDEFNTTYQNLKEIKFYKMHIFKYSRREGTKADKMPNQIIPEVQEQRSKKLIELSDQNQQEYHMQLIGKIVEVLFEEQDQDGIKGHTANYLMIKVKEKQIKEYHNQIYKVLITKVENNELIGKLVT